VQKPKKGRYRAIGAVGALLASTLALTAGATPASASPVTQLNACFSPLTGNYATFPLPLTGTLSKTNLLPGETVELTGVSTGMTVAPALVAAGIGAGVISWVTSPALIGTVDPISGKNGVNLVTNTTTVRVDASNTVEGGATLTGTANVQFFVVFDGVATVQIFIATGTWTGPADNHLLVQVPAIPVNIPVGPGGNPAAPVVFTATGTGTSIEVTQRLGPLPAHLPGPGAPTLAERPLAPIVMLNGLSDGILPPISANFFCWPGQSTGPVDPITGLPTASTTFTPATAATVIASAAIGIPPTAPVCTDTSLSVPINTTVPINLNDHCTDVNGNIDPATFTLSAPGVGQGTVANLGGGLFNYTAPGTDPGPVVLTFQVTDTTGLVSNVATLTITVLADLCDATAAPCALTQIVVQPVVGTTMTMEKVPGVIQMSTVILDGQAQVSTGALQSITVTNARGTASGWTVTAFATDLGTTGTPTWTVPTTGQVIPACSPAGSFGNVPNPDRRCIPGDNLAWSPSAVITHDVIHGDVAQVNPGPAHATSAANWLAQLVGTTPDGAPVDGLGGLQADPSQADELCSAPDTRSGGTFQCDATMWLGVPASAAAGIYTGGLVITLL
jgi:hypothetical protein